ncbi:MAG: putative Zn-dependent peptidase [Acidobacteria bacterium]|nr:putative Zn-dependent peptidase [Acidobacteriota bacterium]
MRATPGLMIAGLMMIMTLPLIGEEQTTPPAPAAPREANLPKPAEKTLPNGLRVIVVRKKGAPIVAAKLMVKTGGEADPADRAGLADMTASLLTKGTKTRDAKQIAEGVEALGATLTSNASWDSSAVDLSVMNVRFQQALAFVADVVRNPAFAQDELDRLREQNVDALRVAMRQPAALSRMVTPRVLYGDAAYGHNLGGTPESLARITRDDVAKFHRQQYGPHNAVLVVAGDVTPASVFATAEKLFGGWKGEAGGGKATITVKTAASPAAASTSPSAAAPRVVVIDLPDAGQAAVTVAKLGLRRADPAYSVSQVANSILGGGYSSRLNQEIRIKRGLSYGASSGFDLRRDVGPFGASAQTKNESATEVAGIILEELNRMGGEAVGDPELGPRKAVLIGGFGRSLETSSGIVSRIAALALHGLSLDEINRYISGVQAVSAADVQKFSAAHLGATDASIVIIGDAKKFLEPLRKRFGNVEVIPIAELDLNGAVGKR